MYSQAAVFTKRIEQMRELRKKMDELYTSFSNMIDEEMAREVTGQLMIIKAKWEESKIKQ